MVLSRFETGISFAAYDYLLFIAMGVVGGLLSALWIKAKFSLSLTEKLNFLLLCFRKKYKPKYGWILGPVQWTALIALGISILNFPRLIGDFVSATPINSLEDFLHQGDLSSAPHSRDWNNRSVEVNLLVYFVMRWIGTLIAITVAVPCGLYFPNLLIGASFGRLVGNSGDF